MFLEEELPAARIRAAQFLNQFASSSRLVVYCHFDADGLAAGAVLGRGLQRLGFQNVLVVSSQRGESAFADEARGRLRATKPDGLIITDLGVNRAGVLPQVPTLYVDHHQPDGTPPEAVVVSGYGWQPIPCSAWLAYELLAPLVDIDDLGWIAAIGTISDLGDAAPWERLPAIKKRYTAKWLKESVALINAARRASAFDIATPLALLLEAEEPKAISQDAARGAEKLHAYRAEVNAALREARKAAPRFAVNQPFALLLLDSPCQIHPLLAQQWRNRLPRYAVVAANRGYVPPLIAFSIRTARGDLNLPQLLRSLDIGAQGMGYGYGHDQASGGQLPPDVFARLLSALGFVDTPIC